MELQTALEVVRLAGYRVAKPRKPQQTAPALNAIGKPYGSNFDPNYKVKHKVSYAHLFRPYTHQLRNHLTA